MQDYNAKAPAEGRTERLQNAFVEMRIMTQQQAATFTQGVRQAEESLAGQSFASPEAEGQAIQAQLELFARLNPVGAQYSACEWGWGLVIGGGVAALVGVLVADENPTCHPDYNRGYSCQKERCSTCRDSDGYSYDCNCYWYWTTCYPQTCDRPGYYPYRDEGNAVAIAGGVALIAGAAVLLINRDSCY
jgi:hypothetical protein